MDRQEELAVGRRLFGHIDGRTTDLADALFRNKVVNYSCRERAALERDRLFRGLPMFMGLSTRLAKPGGTAVILGVMAQGAKISIEPFDVLFRELRVLGSFINPFTHKRAADLVSSGAIELDRLISREVGLDEVPGIIAKPAGPGEVKVLYVA